VAPEKLAVFQSRAEVIVSYHNFETTPNLDAVLRRLQKVPAGAYKLAATARKPTDIARVLDLARRNPRVPLVLLAMGETGFPTRVLSASFGGLFTYAAPLSMNGTAAGQVSAKQLRHFYRVEKFTKSAKVFGVIADPVRHSISPAVHNRAFQARRLDAVYVPLLVAPAQIKDLFALADALPLAGFSVTIPHKQRVMRYLDHIDPAARRIGAVNTVWKKAGKWRGANTDVEGIIRPLERRLRLAGSSVLVAGNGGAARGAVCALSDAGANISVCGRNPDRVRALARLFNAEPLSIAAAEKRDFDALIHATPVGMYPHGDACFFADRIPAGVVFDMVYNPRETVLLKRAAQQGKKVIGGLEMFIEQAVRQFEIWTGGAAPRAAMEKAAFEALEHRGL
jgi:3-dehydroquinate dehydratase/shikimate dehydrogenase